jgi:hypothetical protein
MVKVTDDVITAPEPPEPETLDINGTPTEEVSDDNEPEGLEEAEDQA